MALLLHTSTHLAFRALSSTKQVSRSHSSQSRLHRAVNFAPQHAPSPLCMLVVKASSDQVPVPYEEPDTAKEAIKLGLTLCQQKRWSEALPLFETALQLPGSGLKRYRDKPNAISETEKVTALYNIACCHSNLGDVRSGLLAVAGCLEGGYANFNQLRNDPDLSALRADAKFEGLLVRFEPKKGTFDLFGLFNGN